MFNATVIFDAAIYHSGADYMRGIGLLPERTQTRLFVHLAP